MDFFTRQARKRLIGKINKAVAKTQEEGRLKFVENDTIEYIGKEDGLKRTMTMDECAAMFWSAYNENMQQEIGLVGGNLMTFEITPDDFRKAMIELRGK